LSRKSVAVLQLRIFFGNIFALFSIGQNIFFIIGTIIETFVLSNAGLPDGFFSNQKSQLG
jgi:hypothetical protein